MDDRIYLLAKKISDEQPATIQTRIWIDELVRSFREDAQSTAQVNELLRKELQAEREFTATLQRQIHEVALRGDCEQCRAIAELTESIPVALSA